MSNLIRSLTRSLSLRRLYFNALYYRNPPWDTGISPPELLDFIHSHPAGHALDLGCGTGTNAITLARSGWQVIAIDFAWRAIRIARQKARRSGVTIDFQVGDVTRLERLDQDFDLIFDLGCFHSLPADRRPAYLQNLEGLLNPHGTYLMYGFIKRPGDEGPGLLDTDLTFLADHLLLVKRQDGTDRGERPSAWFTYRRRENTPGSLPPQTQSKLDNP